MNGGMEMKSTDLQRSIETDMSASFWLKKAIVTAEGRDPLDALRDAETLQMYCQLRMDEIRFGQSRKCA